MKERDAGLIELLEKFVPTDPVEPLIRRVKGDPQDAGVPILFGGLDGCRPSAPLVRPFADDVMIRGLLGIAIARFGVA
jgi:hypothetical protein